MALFATNRFAGDGATTSYEFNFVGKYIARPHVKVYQEDNATKARTPIAITDSNFLNDTTLRNLPVTPAGKTLVIYRDTPKPPLVDFTNGSRFTEYNMDLVARQGLFVAMEAMDAGDIDAREQLLAAIAGVTGLVDDATVAVSDATAAALAAATSASNAAASASAVGTAKTAAQAAQSGAEAAQTGAQTAAGNSAASALAASDSATAAAGSATTANTRANAAATSATNAATSASTASTQATNAANSATNASNSAAAAAAAAATIPSIQGPMACRVVVTNLANRTLTLQRCGGQTMNINGVSRVIPAAGVSINVANIATPQYIYARWNGSTITLIENGTPPTFDLTLGQWIYPGIPDYTPVAFFRGDGLATPNRFLRNYYNADAPSFTNSLTSDYTGNWDAVGRQIVTAGILLLPGDTIEVVGQAAIMSTPVGRVGDLTIKLGGSVLARARNTHSGETYLWQNYNCSWATQRGAGASAPAQEAVFELWYFPISSAGNTWLALGDSVTTRIIIRIIPSKWA